MKLDETNKNLSLLLQVGDSVQKMKSHSFTSKFKKEKSLFDFESIMINEAVYFNLTNTASMCS
jgi:hypothetical protein